MEEIDTSRRAPFGSNPNVGEAGRATQQRILAAADEAFAADGYARTSVEAITDLAGCSRPTFYQYFSGKEDIHRRLAARFGAELAELLARMGPITNDRAGRDELCRWLEGLSDVHARYRAIADNFAAAVRTDDQMVTGSSRLSAAYRDRLGQMITDPLPATIPVEVLAAAINATAYGAALYRVRVGNVDQERLSAALADTIHRSLFGPIEGVNLGARVAAAPAPAAPEQSAPNDDDLRQSRGMATRAKLLDAAANAFGMLGYDGVRIDDIAAEAGVSHGTFYRYFSDKDAIYSQQADAVTAEAVALLASWPLNEEGDVRQWAKGYYELFGRLGGIIACLPEARAAGLECAARGRETTAAALRKGLKDRSFGDTDADVVICFALMENLAATAYRSLGISIDDAIEATALIVRRGIFAQPE